MFSELSNILDADPETPPSGQFILVGEINTDGTFVLHHHVCRYLRSHHNVCFLGLSQAFNHYSNVCMKLGVSLTTAKENGNLVFIEALSRCGQNIAHEVTGNGTESNDPERMAWRSLVGEVDTLEPLFRVVKKAIEQLPDWKVKPLLLVVDDLSILQTLGVSCSSIVWFVHYLQQFLIRSTDGAFCLLTLLHQDRDADGEEEQQLLLRQLSHQSDVTIETRGLLSGYSKEVHGEVSVIGPIV